MFAHLNKAAQQRRRRHYSWVGTLLVVLLMVAGLWLLKFYRSITSLARVRPTPHTSTNGRSGPSDYLVTEEDFGNFYNAVSLASALGFFRGHHGPLEETAWVHVTVHQLEQMEQSAIAALQGDGRYLRWFQTLLAEIIPRTQHAVPQVHQHPSTAWRIVRPRQPFAIIAGGLLLDRLHGEKDLVWARRAAEFYATRLTALDHTLAGAQDVLTRNATLEQFAATVQMGNPMGTAHGQHKPRILAAAPLTPMHGVDHSEPSSLQSIPLENAWTVLIEAGHQNWDSPAPEWLHHLADAIPNVRGGPEIASVLLSELSDDWDEFAHRWQSLNTPSLATLDVVPPSKIGDRNRCSPGSEQPQYGGRWEIARVDATEVEDKCPPAADIDKASSQAYGWAGDQLIKAQNEWTKVQLCVKQVDTQKCIREEDRSYNRCDREEVRSYNSCNQWASQCCTWWPCSWLCEIITWVCLGWTWISHKVCVIWTWISHKVCVIWTWVKKIVCVAWEYVKAIPCVIQHAAALIGNIFLGLGGVFVGGIIRTTAGWVDTICKLFNVKGTTRQSSVLKVVGIHCAVLHTNKVMLFSYDEGVHPVNPSHPADFTAVADSDRALCAIWDIGSKKATYVKVGRNIFCSHHAFTSDGELFVASGQFPLPGLPKSLIPPTLLAPGADRDVHVFSPQSEQWRRLPDMEKGRWYPTCATLPDGQILIASGTNGYATSAGLGRHIQDTWQIANPFTNDVGSARPFGYFDGRRFRPQHFFHLYPFMHVMPSGKVFVHFKRTTVLLDPVMLSAQRIAQGTAAVDQTGQTQHLYSRTGPGPGTSVLLPLTPRRSLESGAIEYPSGRILILGGGGQEAEPEPPDPTDSDGYNLHSSTPATNSSEILDLDDTIPQWRFTNEFMKYRRVMPDVVLLPTGKVLVVGGGQTGKSGGLLAHFTSADAEGAPDTGATNPVLQPELFDPVTETWEQLCAKPLARLYHTTAVLLPDARVLVAGHDGALNMSPFDASHYELEIFSPPYLFAANGLQANRPVITSAPSVAVYGQTVTIQTPNAAHIASVSLIRQSSVTHQINSDQRLVVLPILGSSPDKLTVLIPPNGNIAPPGFYMVFLVSKEGVPSEASWLKVGPMRP